MVHHFLRWIHLKYISLIKRLDQSNVDAIKSLYAYNGVTLLNNNENTVMKVMYKSK